MAKLPIRSPRSIRPPAPSLNPLNRIDTKYMQNRSVRNPTIISDSRSFAAIVGTRGTSGVDFTDIQEAVDSVRTLGGGSILIKVGTYRPPTFITLYSNIHLVGEDPERTILDFSGSQLATSQSAIFAGGEEVTNTGSISTTSGSSIVSGGSADFVSKGVREGDVIYINAHPYTIKSVEANDSLTIKELYRGISVSSDIYAILRPKKNISLENFTIINNGSGTSIGGVLFTWCEKVRCERVRVRNFSGFGFTAESCFNFTFMECEANNCLTGFEIHDEASGDRVTNGTITNCYSWGNSSRGYNLDGVSIARLINSTANGNNLGIRIRGDEIVVSECHSEFNVLDGIRVDNSIYNRVVGNNCSSNENGIVLFGSNQNNTVVGNICELNTNDGINVNNGEGNTIVGNQCVANSNYGVLLTSNASLTRLSGNELAGNTAGRVSDSSTTTVRDTRFVPVTNAVELVNGDPSGTGWSSVDVTANTSSTTYALSVSVFFAAATINRRVFLRKSGSGLGQSTLTEVGRIQNALFSGAFSHPVVETSTGQSFAWSVDHADVSAVIINLRGYYEFTD